MDNLVSQSRQIPGSDRDIRWWVSMGLVVFVLALSACGVSSSGSSSPPVSTPPVSPPPSTGNNSFPTLGSTNLALTVNSAQTVSELIGPAGGSVETTATDGTIYKLQVPAGALSAFTAIAITPVTAIDNLPLDDGLATAVELSPAGLEFAVPAILTITVTDNTIFTRTTGFLWEGADNAFALSLARMSDDGLQATFLVEHFSGYGLGIPGNSQLASLAADMLALESELPANTALTAADINLLVGADAAQFATIMTNIFNDVVQPRLTLGSGDVLHAFLAHEIYSRWRVITLLGPDSDALTNLRINGRNQDLTNLFFHYSTYLQPFCSGVTADWLDWIRIPDELRILALVDYPQDLEGFPALSGGLLSTAANSCVTLEIDFVNPPSTLSVGQDIVDLTLRSRVNFPGGSAPVGAMVKLTYSDGASGEDNVTTDLEEGLIELEVHRDIDWPGIEIAATGGAVIPEQRFEVLYDEVQLLMGDNALRFTQELTAVQTIIAPSSVVPLELSFIVDGAPVEGATVQFSLSGPGTLSASSAQTILNGNNALASINYVAPADPVIRGFEAKITATVNHNGQNYQASRTLIPYWVEMTLLVNTGSGFVNGSNNSVELIGSGPFALRADVVGAGATTLDPPIPLNQQGVVEFAASNPVESTLKEAGGPCCLSVLEVDVNNNGQALIEWSPESAEPVLDHVISALYKTVSNGNSGVSVSVTLQRPGIEPLSVTVAGPFIGSVPGVLPGQVSQLSVFVPPGSAQWVELQAVGVQLDAVAGAIDASGIFTTEFTSTPGHSCVWIEARVYPQAGDPSTGTGFYTAPVQMLNGATIVSRGTMFVDVDSEGSRQSNQANAAASPHFCSLAAPAGPDYTVEWDIGAEDDYVGTDPSCAGSTASGRVTRAIRFQKNGLLTELAMEISGTVETMNSGFAACFDPPGATRRSDAYAQGGIILTLLEPAFVTFTNASANASPNCGSARVRLAGALTVGDGFGSGPTEEFACVISNGSCVDSSSSFAGTLPVGRYQINAVSSLDYKSNLTCSSSYSATVTVLEAP